MQTLAYGFILGCTYIKLRVTDLQGTV